MQIIDTNDTNSFFHNGRKYVKNFIVQKIGETHIAIYNAYDTRFQLFPTTHYSEVQVDGVIHDGQASLMEALSLIVFSKIVGGGTSTQNNTAIYYTNGLLDGDGDITATEVAEWLNNREYAINIGETNTPTIFEFLRAENGGTKKYLFLFLRGKGVWGAAQGANPNIVYSSNFKLISVQTLTPQDLEEDENTHINYLGIVEDGNFVTVANQNEWSFTGATQQYYFSFTKEQTLYFALFVGTPDVYGSNTGNDFSESDFVLTTNSEQEPIAVPNLQQVLTQGATGRIRTPVDIRTTTRANAFDSHVSRLLLSSGSTQISSVKTTLNFPNSTENNFGSSIILSGGSASISAVNLTIKSDETIVSGNTFFHNQAKYSSLPLVNEFSDLSFAHKAYVDYSVSNVGNNFIPYEGATQNINLGGRYIKGATGGGEILWELSETDYGGNIRVGYGNSSQTNITVNRIFRNSNGSNQTYNFPDGSFNYTLPITVNGFNADENGNINLGTPEIPTLDSVLREGNVSSRPITIINDATTEKAIIDSGKISIHNASGATATIAHRQNNLGIGQTFSLPDLGNFGSAIFPISVNGVTANNSGNIVLPDVPVPAWGNITGFLSAQTDLTTYLDLKFDKPIGLSSQYVRGDGSLATLPTGSTPTTSLPFSAITGSVSGNTNLQTALNAKFNNPTGTTSQYVRGDGSIATFTAGGGTWGTITGVLSAQTDLQTAFNGKINIIGNTFLSGSTTRLTLASNEGTLLTDNNLSWASANKELSIGMSGTGNSGRINVYSQVFQLAVQDNIASGQATIVFNSNQDDALTFKDKSGNSYMSFRTISGSTGVILRQREIFDEGLFYPMSRRQLSITSAGAGVRVYGVNSIGNVYMLPFNIDTTVAMFEASFIVKNATASQVIAAKFKAVAKRVGGVTTITQQATETLLNNTTTTGYTIGIEQVGNNLQFYFQPQNTDSTAYTGAFQEVRYTIN